VGGDSDGVGGDSDGEGKAGGVEGEEVEGEEEEEEEEEEGEASVASVASADSGDPATKPSTILADMGLSGMYDTSIYADDFAEVSDEGQEGSDDASGDNRSVDRVTTPPAGSRVPSRCCCVSGADWSLVRLCHAWAP
jgi:hypothetical protein